MELNTFVYTDLTQAEYDLKLFSGMNAHEGKPLYLVRKDETGLVITATLPQDAMQLESIAVNGHIFTR